MLTYWDKAKEDQKKKRERETIHPYWNNNQEQIIKYLGIMNCTNVIIIRLVFFAGYFHSIFEIVL